MDIYEKKFIIRNAKVFLHYDTINQSIHIDLRMPKHKVKDHLIENKGIWVTKKRCNDYTDIKIILKKLIQ